jgi:hypothetical protein
LCAIYLNVILIFVPAIKLKKIIGIMKVSASTIQDVKRAFEHGKKTLSFMDHLSGEWIFFVDPETMEEVKSLYNESDGTGSLYRVFSKILKM